MLRKSSLYTLVKFSIISLTFKRAAYDYVETWKIIEHLLESNSFKNYFFVECFKHIQKRRAYKPPCTSHPADSTVNNSWLILFYLSKKKSVIFPPPPRLFWIGFQITFNSSSINISVCRREYFLKLVIRGLGI